MSGKRHHYIPQFLQRGFVSHSCGGEFFTWVYRRNTQPFNTNIANTGVEGYFYSQGEDSHADDNITVAEDSYFALVDALRGGSKEAIDDSNSLSELVTHLELRTRHLRQNFSNTASLVLEEMARFMEDEQAFGSYMTKRVKSDPSFMRGVIADELKNRNLPDSLLPHLVEASQLHWEQTLPALLADMSLVACRFRAEIPKIAKEGAKSGHIKALKETLSPEAMVRRYRNLKYCVLQSKVALPLGDSSIVIQLKGERPFKAFCDKDDSIEAVYLPLSSDLILVGSIDDAVPNISTIPMVTAQCSLEYFISSSNNDANNIIHARIGEYAHLLTEDQIYRLITEVKRAD